MYKPSFYITLKSILSLFNSYSSYTLRKSPTDLCPSFPTRWSLRLSDACTRLIVNCCRQNSLSSWPVPHVVAAPVTSRHLTHVLLQPVASVINPTPAAVCHTGNAADDIIVADQWRRSLVIDTNDPYMPVVSGLATLWFLNAIAALAYTSCDFCNLIACTCNCKPVQPLQLVSGHFCTVFVPPWCSVNLSFFVTSHSLH